MDHPWMPAVKEEYVNTRTVSGRQGDSISSSSSSSCSNSNTYFKNMGRVPQSMEAMFNDGKPPPFVTKTFDMVDDPTTAPAVSWNQNGHSFIVWDTHALSTTLLPKYFKHSNFSSFVRQLNTYGFRKIDPDRWEFANEGFLRGHKHLLKFIRRRKVSDQSTASCVVDLDKFVGGGTSDDTEVNRLRHDKEILMWEMTKLRQEQQNTRTCLQNMEQRIQCTEQKQRRVMSFIARAVQNSDFIHQREIEEADSSNGKRRLHSMNQGSTTNQCQGSEQNEYEVSELETLALEIQGHRKAGKAQRKDEQDIDEELWEELLSTRWLDINDDTQQKHAGNSWARTSTSSNKNSKVNYEKRQDPKSKQC